MSTVRSELADGVATVTIDRTDAMNALDVATKIALRDTLATVASDPAVRCVVLTGAGRAFCVGQDLNESQARRAAEEPPADPDQPLPVLVDEYNPLILALSRLPVPLVVGINGACAGAGMGIALTGDLRVAAAGDRAGRR